MIHPLKHAPLKKVNKKQLRLRSKPWVTSHKQKLTKHRDKLLKKLKKSHSRNTEELYKKFRNRVVSENRKSKINYFDTYFQANKSNMKNLWTGIKSIIKTKSKSSLQSISQLTANCETIKDPKKMANLFSNFFVSASNQVTPSII